MKMLKKVAVGLVVAIVALLAYAATRPDTLRVERTVRIQAPPERIHPLISDFHKWASWSPYEKLDPAMKRTHSGAASGKGAVYEWDGNNQVGQGRMEILETAPSRITIQLDFIRPFEGHNIAEFALEPGGGSTNVAWVMHGPTGYLGKLMGVFVNMDTMIGRDFETGLANLKSLAESAP